jgi:hypothetical protein
MEDAILKEAARITFWYIVAFLFNVFGVQVYFKFSALIQHKANKAKGSKVAFNRYTDVRILAADRSVGNFVEWMGPFLALFWVNAALTGKGLEYGWLYVGIRVLYPFLALAGGITPAGPQPLIFLATLPGYYVLGYYMYQIYGAL